MAYLELLMNDLEITERKQLKGICRKEDGK